MQFLEQERQSLPSYFFHLLSRQRDRVRPFWSSCFPSSTSSTSRAGCEVELSMISSSRPSSSSSSSPKRLVSPLMVKSQRRRKKKKSIESFNEKEDGLFRKTFRGCRQALFSRSLIAYLSRQSLSRPFFFFFLFPFFFFSFPSSGLSVTFFLFFSKIWKCLGNLSFRL